MFKSNFFINPKRKDELYKLSLKNKIVFNLKNKLIWLGVYLGFRNINYSYVHGNKSRLTIGLNCSTMNTIFNLISGDVKIGDDTIFGHNCMVLTGNHKFINGKRASLHNKYDENDETPKFGRDIEIGKGCFIGSGVIIIGPVKIGDNVIIGSGSVVNKDLPSNIFCAGIPAKAIKNIE